jgi:exosortase A-associated hydrolase 1
MGKTDMAELMNEAAIGFACKNDTLVGILHRPEHNPRRGILIAVAGGPQYRVGGHRQLVLWARRMAAEGYAVFRFDYRGWGDSHGEFHDFDVVDEDISSAMDCFKSQVPELEEIVMWGECNAASAILFYAYRDARIKGLVLLNPWVRTVAGQAKAIVRHYYLQRLMEPGFWKKIVSGRFNPLQSMKSAFKLIAQSRKSGSAAKRADVDSPTSVVAELPRDLSLPDRMLAGLSRFNGPIMLVMSGRDLIAREFDELVRGSAAWQAQLNTKPLTRHDFVEADHTFSSAAERNQVVTWGLQWLRQW